MSNINRTALVAIAAASLSSVGAQANTVTAVLYKVPESVVNSSTAANPANVPSGPGDLTFSVTTPGINFHSGFVVSVQTWLNSGNAINLTNNNSFGWNSVIKLIFSLIISEALQ